MKGESIKVTKNQEDENICPICQKENHCDAQNAHQCWCMTISFPKELISQLPEELKGKRCICKNCIMEYNNLSY